MATLGSPSQGHAAVIPCPTLTGYQLSQCLKERAARAASAGQADSAAANAAADAGDNSVEAERLKYKQYEQPGTLVTLPSGIQYREIEVGRPQGPAAQLGDTLEICYIVYRLSGGTKFSSGNTPVFLFSLGYGNMGQDDLGSTYRFRLGDPYSLPPAATPAILGMRQGGIRRILVPPQLGWVDKKVGPRPKSFGSTRRLESHKDEPLLLQVELKKLRPAPA